MNGHGGNYVLGNLVQQATARWRVPGSGSSRAREDWNDARDGSRDDQHLPRGYARRRARSLDPSAAFPDAVRDGWDQDDHTADDRRHLGVLGMSAYTKSGVIGRPSLATPEKGRAALDHLVGKAQHILRILDETSNEE